MTTVTVEECIEAGKTVLERLTPSDRNLLNFLNLKIEECIIGEAQASEAGDHDKATKYTQAYFRLLGQAYHLGTKYPREAGRD